MNEYITRAREIIGQNKYVTIATVTAAGQPWNSPVFAVVDGQYNFYWTSPAQAQHSQNISVNPQVFLVIYDSQATEGEGTGVYISARAKALNDTQEIDRALLLLANRAHKSIDYMNKLFDGDRLKLYQATPEHVWTNVTRELGGKFIDERVEIKLN